MVELGMMTASADIGGDPRIGGEQVGARSSTSAGTSSSAATAPDVGVGGRARVEAVLVEPGGQAAVEVLEPVEGDDARADPLEERQWSSARSTGRRVSRTNSCRPRRRSGPRGRPTDHALHGAIAGQGPSRGQRARLQGRQRERRRRVRRPQRGVALGGGLRVKRARHAAHLGREVHDPVVVRRALGRVAAEQVVIGRPARERGPAATRGSLRRALPSRGPGP